MPSLVWQNLQRVVNVKDVRDAVVHRRQPQNSGHHPNQHPRLQPIPTLRNHLPPLAHPAPQPALIYNQALNTNIFSSPKNLRKSIAVGVVLHSDRTPASASNLRVLTRTLAASFATLALAAC